MASMIDAHWADVPMNSMANNAIVGRIVCN